MLSNILDKVSFWSLYIVIVFLPIFFLPFTKIPVEASKGLLLVVGLVVSIVCWAAARFSDGKVTVPRSWILVSGLGIVLAFLASSLVHSPAKVSLFGILLDIGTFWSIFSAYLLMVFSSLMFKNKKDARLLLLGLLGSLFVVFTFQVFRLFAPNTLSFGALVGKTANLAGSWNSLGLLAVLGILISLFVMEFYTISKPVKIALSSFLVVAIFMTVLINFPLAWELLGIFALFIFIYKISSYSNLPGKESVARSFPTFSFTIVLVSLLFFISGQFIGGYVPSRFGISNIEVSPTFASTMQIAKSALKENPVFGVGPNNFEHAWSKYKAPIINTSEYWNTSFYTGSGLLPTFLVTTGILGMLSLLVFFYLVFSSGIKKLFANIKSSENLEITIFSVSVIFLVAASFLYATGITIFLFIFAFSGVLVGLLSGHKEKGEIEIQFLEDPRKSFVWILTLVVIMLLASGMAFKYIQRFVSAQYFGKALLATNTQDSLKDISKAVQLYQNDLYFRTYSQVELLLISQAAEKSKTETLSEAEKAALQDNYNQAVQSATFATQYNPKNTLNWQLLASVYHSVSNLGLTKEYDKAIEYYQKAITLDPLNPSIHLSIASVYLSKQTIKEARESIQEALRLKPNYTEALIMMSQLEKSKGNQAAALSYAQDALSTLPYNKELADYVESLKTSGNTSPEPSKEKEKEADLTTKTP